MTRFALHRVALIAGLGSLLIAGSIRLDAQNKAQTNAQQPTFRAGANFVRVDVYPTIKGAAVRDLTAARLRHPRGRRPAEDRVLRVRERARGRAGGRAARAQYRGGGASDCRDDEGPPVRDLPRHVLRRRRRLASAATDARQFPPPHPRARRHVRRHDAGDVGAGHQLRAPHRHDRRVSLEVLVLGPARPALSDRSGGAELSAVFSRQQRPSSSSRAWRRR